MRELGLVQGISGSGKLIVRASGRLNLRIGQMVFDKKGRHIGAIWDVIGPIAKPFVLVDVIGALPKVDKLYLR